MPGGEVLGCSGYFPGGGRGSGRLGEGLHPLYPRCRPLERVGFLTGYGQ